MQGTLNNESMKKIADVNAIVATFAMLHIQFVTVL